MKIGFSGLGKMGRAMVLHLLEEGVDVVVYNRTKQKIDELCAEFNNETVKQWNHEKKIGKLIKAYELMDLVNQLDPPRIIWLMVPQGRPVDEMIFGRKNSEAREQKTGDGTGGLIEYLSKGDIVIDGGNSFYKDSVRRFGELNKLGIHFLDIGVSGGLEGASSGACMMVGGEKEIFEKVKPVLEKMAVKDGLAYFGPAGAGHFVKMVHNGVEYGMLEAIGEGFEILNSSHYHFDMHEVAGNWSHGSVVRGWLMELLERALKKDSEFRSKNSELGMKNPGREKWLKEVSGEIGGGTTGKWTVETAKELGVEVPAIEAAVEARKKSLKKPRFSGKVIASLRKEFGGHNDLFR